MQLDKLEKILSLFGHISRVIALFLPWIILSLILVENDIVIDSQGFMISMIYSNSVKFGELLELNFEDYMILSLIATGASLILIINEILRIKQKLIGIKDSEFMRYLQLFSQIVAILVLVGVFSILGDVKFIHPMMSAESQIEGESQKLIVESRYSFGLYLWLLSIILTGPETLSNISLVYSTLGGISVGKAEIISKKINSIIHYYIATISSNETESKEKADSMNYSGVKNEKMNFKLIENSNEKADRAKDTNALDEFNKLFLKKK